MLREKQVKLTQAEFRCLSFCADQTTLTMLVGFDGHGYILNWSTNKDYKRWASKERKLIKLWALSRKLWVKV